MNAHDEWADEALAPVESPPPPSSLVLGLGQTGYSVVEFLRARGEPVAVADTREHPPYLPRLRKRYPQVEVILGRLPVERYPEFDRLVVSPGLAPPRPSELVYGDGERVEVLGDIELFAQCLHQTHGAPVIGVTGSNGKSTVTTMVAEMLNAGGYSALPGGNLGPPALNLLAEPRPDFYVLELSSFQLQTTRRIDLAAAAVLNLSEDHLDRHRDMREYAAAKSRILEGAAEAVLNRDDPGSAELRAAHPDAVTFGLGRPPDEFDYGVIDAADGRFLARGDAPLAAAEALTAPGAHNMANALAALALVECAGVEVTPVMADALLAWCGLEHRCELVATIDGVRWVNDSKATNVGATMAAIAGLCGDADAPPRHPRSLLSGGGDGGVATGKNRGLLLIAGGDGKGADFMPLRALVERHVGRAVLFGRDAPRLAEALSGAARLAPAHDLRQAVGLAAAVVKPGQTVLFSPACASFDQFRDYQMRGRAFKKIVAELAAESESAASPSAPSPSPPSPPAGESSPARQAT